MRFLSGCLMGLLLAALLFVGYFIFFAQGSLPLEPATATATQSDMTVIMSERLVNTQMRAQARAQGQPIQNMTLKLHAPNRADVTGTMTIALFGEGITVQPQASLHFGVTNGRVAVTIDSVNVSGFNVPSDIVDSQARGLKADAETQLNTQLQRALANTGLHLVSIEATESELIMRLSQ